ncbi:MAG: nucleotidyltransferase family protein [bacterium]
MKRLNYSGEDKLIFGCSVKDTDGSTHHLLQQAINSNLDWDYIVENALGNGTSSLLYRNLRKIDEDCLVPGWVIEKLSDVYFDVRARNIFLLEELGKVLKKFNEEKISSVVLKGASILENVYQDIGLRTMGDIDILIRKEQFCEIDKSLRESGYFSDYNWSDYMNISTSRYLNSLYYQKRQGEIYVFLHLHWHIINTTVPTYYYNDIDIQRFWQQARPVTIAGVKSSIMAPHHLLIHLSEHILKHSCRPFVLFCDIFEVINHYSKEGLDWDLLIKDTVEFNLNKAVYFGLYFSSELSGAEVPANVLARLKPSHISYGERKIQSLVEKNRTFPGLKYFLYFVMNEKLADKLKFILRVVFPPREVLALQYVMAPEDIRFYHYFLKLRNAFVKGLKILPYLWR